VPSGAARQRARARLLESIPPHYSPALHLLATTGIGVALLVAGALEVKHLRPLELLAIPVIFLLSNAFEWSAHRNILHRARPPLQVLYRKHTPEHHMVYVEDDMAIRSFRELHLVLIPAAGVLAIVIALAPVAAGAGFLFTANTGWLVLLTGGLYMVGYELSHLSYHLPPESFIGRRSLVRVLRRHHARHHDPRLMQRWNFNVTIPLWDWVRGTIARDDAAVDRHAAHPAAR
jgi:hypothetical protein